MEGKISKFSRTCLPYQDCSLLPATILHVNISDAAGGCQGAYINPKKVSVGWCFTWSENVQNGLECCN